MPITAPLTGRAAAPAAGGLGAVVARASALVVPLRAQVGPACAPSPRPAVRMVSGSSLPPGRYGVRRAGYGREQLARPPGPA